MDPERLRMVPVWVVALLISGSFHEFAHAWAGVKLGDPTPERMGRLTLNPLPHIDPMGLIFIIITALTGFGIGWMKPVQLNPYNFRNPRRDMMLTGLAGPLMNFILAGIFILIFKLDPSLFRTSNPVGNLLEVFLLLNIILGVFNLFPIPPLDGGHIIKGILPEAMAEWWESVERYGFIIFIVLLVTGVLQTVLGFFVNLIFRFILT